VVNEYDQFIATDDVHVNGKLTLGENVGDLGGLKLAWMAYMAHAAGLAPDQKRNVDGFTPEQRFFIAYAQGWCENDTPEILRMGAQTDPHSPVQYRVNGVLVNLPQFRQTFSCKTGTPMAPEKRCAVW
jgi:endothelin-converting enzyme/putative endopeptidase